jgi:hypothetical protein
MEIESFDTETDFTVTLWMTNMPEKANTGNTSVSIAGVLQGGVAVYKKVPQKIVFKALRDAQKGNISVMINLPDGDVTAESTAEFTPPEEEPENERPVVKGISQTSVAPGTRLSLRGENLGKVTGVGLQVGGLYKVCQLGAVYPTAVSFGVPLDTSPSPEGNPYPVCIKTSSFPSFRRTNVRLTIMKK